MQWRAYTQAATSSGITNTTTPSPRIVPSLVVFNSVGAPSLSDLTGINGASRRAAQISAPGTAGAGFRTPKSRSPHLG